MTFEKDVYSQKIIGILLMVLPVLSIGVTYLVGVFSLGNLVEIHNYPSYIIFEGISLALGLYLILYKGYDLKDKILSIVSGIAIIAVVLFPYSMENQKVDTLFGLSVEITSLIQGISQAVFILTLSIITLFQFPKGDSKNKNKKLRNFIYYICGSVSVIFALTLIVVSLLGASLPFNLFLIFQSLILLSLGFSWVTKSGIIFSDKRKKVKK